MIRFQRAAGQTIFPQSCAPFWNDWRPRTSRRRWPRRAKVSRWRCLSRARSVNARIQVQRLYAYSTHFSTHSFVNVTSPTGFVRSQTFPLPLLLLITCRGKWPADPALTLQDQTRCSRLRKTPLGTPSDKTKICSVLSDFLLGEVSLRRFDTVTRNKSRHCMHLR